MLAMSFHGVERKNRKPSRASAELGFLDMQSLLMDVVAGLAVDGQLDLAFVSGLQGASHSLYALLPAWSGSLGWGLGRQAPHCGEELVYTSLVQLTTGGLLGVGGFAFEVSLHDRLDLVIGAYVVR
jgi:hypothetical protein